MSLGQFEGLSACGQLIYLFFLICGASRIPLKNDADGYNGTSGPQSSETKRLWLHARIQDQMVRQSPHHVRRVHQW